MAREQFQTLTEPMYYILLALTRECCGVEYHRLEYSRFLMGECRLDRVLYMQCWRNLKKMR